MARRTDTKQQRREVEKAYLTDVAAATGTTLSRIATLIGRNDGTLTNFMRDDRHGGNLDPAIIQEVVEWSGIAFPAIEPTTKFRGFREEATPYEPAGRLQSNMDPIVALIGQRPQAHGWVMKVDLPGAQIRAGDIVIVDQQAEPRDGDLVCCQFESGNSAMTVFRFWYDPYFLPANGDLTSGERETRNPVSRRIAGVVTDVVRRRAAAAAA